MKKTIVLFLTAITVFSLISCTQKEAENVPDYEGASSSEDFGGYEIVFSSDYYEGSGTVLRYDRDTLLADLVLKRISDVENKYNCKIKTTDVDFLNMLVPSVAGGIHICDFAMSYSHTMHSKGIIKGGVLLPISSISDNIDYLDSEKWGNANNLQSLVWNNELYGVIPYSWPGYAFDDTEFPLFVNEEIIKSLGETDPRDYVENGTWTREKLSEVVKAYTYKDNNGETVYGLTLNAPHFFVTAFGASGCTYAYKEGDTWKSGFHTPEGEEALSWASDFMYVENRAYVYGDSSTAASINRFVDGGATMLLTPIGYGLVAQNMGDYKSIVYNLDDFGILPFPLGPNMEYGNWTGVHESTRFAVVFPITCPEPDVTSFVASQIFEPLDGYETKQDVIDYYTKYMLHDERDVEVILKMSENSQYIFLAFGGNRITDAVCMGTGRTSVSEILDAYEDAYYEDVKETIAPMYESVDYLWSK